MAHKPFYLQTPGLHYLLIFIGLFLCFISIHTAYRQDTTATTGKQRFKNQYFFTVGATRPFVSTTLQVNGSRGPGLVVSLEDNLGFNDRPWLFRAEGIAN